MALGAKTVFVVVVVEVVEVVDVEVVVTEEVILMILEGHLSVYKLSKGMVVHILTYVVSSAGMTVTVLVASSVLVIQAVGVGRVEVEVATVLVDVLVVK